MPVTLDMPAEPLTSSAAPPLDTTAADEAAAMLDSVDDLGQTDPDDDEPVDSDEDAGNTDPTDLEAAAETAEEPAADAATEEKPKKKRGRKKKSEQAAEESATPTEPATEQPAEPAATLEPAAEQPPLASNPILDEIALAEAKCERAEWEVILAKKNLKSAKSNYDEAVAELRELAAAVKNDNNRPLFRQPASTLPFDAAVPPAVAPDPDLWRAGKVTELELSEKLIEKLEEAGVSTIGQLEDLRAEISQGKAKWPKGIGKAKITEIEDAVVAWLTKNRDSEVFGQGIVGMPPAAAASDAAPQIAWEDMTEEQQADFINQRCVELDPDEAVNPVDAALQSLEPQHTASRAYFEAGYIAGQNGDKVTDCGWVPGIEQDDWLRGWLKAGKEADDAKTGPPAVAGEVPDDQTIAEETTEVDSLDDL